VRCDSARALEQFVDTLPCRGDELGGIEILQQQVALAVAKLADRCGDIWDRRRHAVRIAVRWEDPE